MKINKILMILLCAALITAPMLAAVSCSNGNDGDVVDIDKSNQGIEKNKIDIGNSPLPTALDLDALPTGENEVTPPADWGDEWLNPTDSGSQSTPTPASTIAPTATPSGNVSSTPVSTTAPSSPVETPSPTDGGDDGGDWSDWG